MDKLAASTANKNTIGYVVPKGYEPYSELRPYEEISAPVDPSAILQRGTPSVMITGSAYKVLIETKRKMYEILTGENFDEVLKQKQPWMDKKPVMESVEPITESQIIALENIFDLERTPIGYVSNKYYEENDLIMPLQDNVDYTSLYHYFGNDKPNVYIDEISNSLRAVTDINPNTVLSL